MFQATHKHAQGGLYQLLGRPHVHAGKDTWVPGVLYTNQKGQQFVRTLENFNKRFKEIKGA